LQTKMCVHMYYYQQSVNIVKTTGVSASRNVSNMAPFIPHTMKERQPIPVDNSNNIINN
jgi:hypothetical protein